MLPYMTHWICHTLQLTRYAKSKQNDAARHNKLHKRRKTSKSTNSYEERCSEQSVIRSGQATLQYQTRSGTKRLEGVEGVSGG